MNRYPAWLNTLVFVVLLTGILFALPNIYGSAPAVQLADANANAITEQQLENFVRTLEGEEITPEAFYIKDDRAVIRFLSEEDQQRAADRLRPFMREVVNDLIDAVAPSGRADVAVDICEPYPIPIICELLGAPKKDWKFFSRVAEDVLRIFNGTVLDELEGPDYHRRRVECAGGLWATAYEFDGPTTAMTRLDGRWTGA